MAFTFNRGYAEIRRLGEDVVKQTSVSEERREWLLDTLKKYGTVDMICEFTKGLDKNSDKVIQPGYIDALSDFLAFAKNYK